MTEEKPKSEEPKAEAKAEAKVPEQKPPEGGAPQESKQGPAASEKAPEGAAPAADAKAQTGPVRKRPWKSVSFAKVFIQCSFNNTIISVTDDKGNVLAWASAGSSGFKGTKKGTPFAAQMTAAKVGRRAVELGLKQVAVFVKGPGPGRETAIRGLQAAGLQVVSIKDVSPIPHNGCRPPKQRRV
ncbi:MAG: 30S ribosomal protein S11 [Elusimicrobiota bacterium]